MIADGSTSKYDGDITRTNQSGLKPPDTHTHTHTHTHKVDGKMAKGDEHFVLPGEGKEAVKGKRRWLKKVFRPLLIVVYSFPIIICLI